jgi:hypothetical protein
MLPRPRSVFEDIDPAKNDARAPVPTGMVNADTALIGLLSAPRTKEETIERFMDVVIKAQKHQDLCYYRVAKAVSRMDSSKEILPLSLAWQDLELMNKNTEDLEALSKLYHRLRD